MPLFYDAAVPALYDAPGTFYDNALPGPGVIKMRKVKTDTKGLSVPEKVARGRTVATKLTGNALLPALATYATELTTATDQLENDYNAALVARETAQQLTVQSGTSESAWDLKFGQGVDLVNANGATETARASSGFPFVGDRTPIGPLPAPANLAVMFGDLPGTLSCTWDSLNGAKSYQVETAPATAGPWTLVLSPTASDCVISGLASGTTYYVRIKAVGAAGVSAPSDIAMKMAP